MCTLYIHYTLDMNVNPDVDSKKIKGEVTVEVIWDLFCESQGIKESELINIEFCDCGYVFKFNLIHEGKKTTEDVYIIPSIGLSKDILESN